MYVLCFLWLPAIHALISTSYKLVSRPKSAYVIPSRLIFFGTRECNTLQYLEPYLVQSTCFTRVGYVQCHFLRSIHFIQSTQGVLLGSAGLIGLCNLLEHKGLVKLSPLQCFFDVSSSFGSVWILSGSFLAHSSACFYSSSWHLLMRSLVGKIHAALCLAFRVERFFFLSALS